MEQRKLSVIDLFDKIGDLKKVKVKINNRPRIKGW